MSAFYAWKLIEDLARKWNVELYGPTRYNRDRHSLIVSLERGDVEVCILAITTARDPTGWLRRGLFRIVDPQLPSPTQETGNAK